MAADLSPIYIVLLSLPYGLSIFPCGGKPFGDRETQKVSNICAATMLDQLSNKLIQ